MQFKTSVPSMTIDMTMVKISAILSLYFFFEVSLPVPSLFKF